VAVVQTAVAERDRDVARLTGQLGDLQVRAEREAARCGDLERQADALTRQRDARAAAAEDAAARLADDAANLRLALDDTARRERQVRHLD